MKTSEAAEISSYLARDVDGITELVSRVFCPHRLTRGSSDIPLHLSMDGHEVAQMKMVNFSYAAPVIVDPEAFEDFILVTSAVSGHGSVRSNRHEALWLPGRTMILSPGTKHLMKFGPNFRQSTLRMPVEAFTRGWLAQNGQPLRHRLDFAPVPLSSEANANWHKLMSLLGSLVTSKLVTPLILNNLLDAAAGMILEGTKIDLGKSYVASPVSLQRAEAFIEAFAAEPITMAEIANAAGCGYRALQAAFHRYRGMTPKAYLTKIRLSLARSDLLNDGKQISVTECAARYGFHNMGRFSRLYSQNYGELPTATLRAHKTK